MDLIEVLMFKGPKADKSALEAIQRGFGVTADTIENIIKSNSISPDEAASILKAFNAIVKQGHFAEDFINRCSHFCSAQYEINLFKVLLKLIIADPAYEAAIKEFVRELRIYELQRKQYGAEINMKAVNFKEFKHTKISIKERLELLKEKRLEKERKERNRKRKKIESSIRKTRRMTDVTLSKFQNLIGGILNYDCFSYRKSKSFDSRAEVLLKLVEEYIKCTMDEEYSEIFQDANMKILDSRLIEFLQGVVEIWQNDERLPKRFGIALESILGGEEWEKAFYDAIDESSSEEESSDIELEPNNAMVLGNSGGLITRNKIAFTLATLSVLFATYYNYSVMNDDDRQL